jgi:hypothetical protein
MPVNIAIVATRQNAADLVARIWDDAGKPNLLRMEGFDGVGKSELAKLVAKRIGAAHVEVDSFAFKPDVPKPYRDCLRSDDLDTVIRSALAMGGPTILDAVCLDEVAPSVRWGRGFVVYVKRLSFNNQNPIWHEGFHIEDEQELPSIEPYRGILLYHRKYKPHDRADLIIELPNIGYTISNFTFDRTNCFDPAGADIIPCRGA